MRRGITTLACFVLLVGTGARAGAMFIDMTDAEVCACGVCWDCSRPNCSCGACVECLHAAGRYATDHHGYSAAYKLGGSTPGKWYPFTFGKGSVITYSFASGDGYPTGESDAEGTVLPLESFMPFSVDDIKAEIRRAFDAWEAVANLTFVEVPDDGARFGEVELFTSSGQIRFGGHAFDGARGLLAHAYFPPHFLASGAGDVHFDVADTWKIGFDGEGFDIFQVAAHEIGHAIGLDHTDVPDSLMNPTYSQAFVGPQADDIAGAVAIYGPPVPEPTTVALSLWAGLFLLARLRFRQTSPLRGQG